MAACPLAFTVGVPRLDGGGTPTAAGAAVPVPDTASAPRFVVEQSLARARRADGAPIVVLGPAAAAVEVEKIVAFARNALRRVDIIAVTAPVTARALAVLLAENDRQVARGGATMALAAQCRGVVTLTLGRWGGGPRGLVPWRRSCCPRRGALLRGPGSSEGLWGTADAVVGRVRALDGAVEGLAVVPGPQGPVAAVVLAALGLDGVPVLTPNPQDDLADGRRSTEVVLRLRRAHDVPDDDVAWRCSWCGASMSVLERCGRCLARFEGGADTAPLLTGRRRR